MEHTTSELWIERKIENFVALNRRNIINSTTTYETVEIAVDNITVAFWNSPLAKAYTLLFQNEREVHGIVSYSSMRSHFFIVSVSSNSELNEI